MRSEPDSLLLLVLLSDILKDDISVEHDWICVIRIPAVINEDSTVPCDLYNSAKTGPVWAISSESVCVWTVRLSRLKLLKLKLRWQVFGFVLSFHN